jgi:hypothetical protein
MKKCPLNKIRSQQNTVAAEITGTKKPVIDRLTVNH